MVLLRISAAHLLHHRLRSAVTFAAIAFAVAATIALSTASTSIVAAMRSAMIGVAGAAELMVGNGDVGVPEDALERVRAVDGVAAAVPLIDATASAPLLGETLVVLGIDLIDDDTVRTYSIADAGRELDDPLTLLAQPESLLLTAEFARRHRLQAEDSVELLTPRGLRPFRVVGLLDPRGPAQAFGGNLAVMDIFGAQKLFGEEGRFDRIDVVVAPNVTRAALQPALQAAVGDLATVTVSEQYRGGIAEQVRAIGFVLQACSLVGISVCLFLVYNAQTISVMQRRREFATLRAAGMTRATLKRHIVVNAMLLGVPACLAGLPLGALAAGYTTAGFAQTIDENIGTVGRVTAEIPLAVYLMACAIGISATVVGAGLPAMNAARLRVSLALRVEPEPAGADSEDGRRRILEGGVLAFLIVGAWFAGPRTFAIMAFPLLAFVAVRSLPTAVGRLAAIAGAVLNRLTPGFGRVATENLRLSPRRTAGSVAAVMLATAALVTIRVVLASVLAAALQWGDSFFPLDLMITSGGPMFGIRTNLLPADFPDAIRRMDGVAEVSRLRVVEQVPTEKGEVRLIVQDFRVWQSRGGKQVLSGIEQPGAIEALERGEVLVSDTFASRTGKGPGETVLISTPYGPKGFSIAGIFAAGFLSYPTGTIQMDWKTFAAEWKESRITSLTLFASPGASLNKVSAEIRNAWGSKYALFVIDRTQFQKLGFERLQRAFAMTSTFEALLAALAAFSVMNTVFASVLDRTRDIALLRAIGATRRQISRGIALECVVLGIFGIIAGVPLGLGASVFLVRAFDYFEWRVEYLVPLASLIVAAVGMLGATLLGSWYPARYASRVTPAHAALGELP